jgi:flagellar protein FlgJ
MHPEVSMQIDPSTTTPTRMTALRAQAAELEVAFLSEMLAHTGLNPSSEGFGGGMGEDQFASFLRDGQARAMVKAGGIGLTESLFRAMGGTDET